MSSPSAFSSKRTVLESGQKQPEGIQGSPVTGISPVVQYHLPQVIPPLHEPCLSLSVDFGGGCPAF